MSAHDVSATALAQWLTEHEQRLAVAESCTGGLLAGALTNLAGCSMWFEAGLVTYRLSAKTNLLGVPAELLARRGAVHEDVARRMAEGVLARTDADFSIATTGLAGPEGDGTGVPVGTLWIAWASRNPAWVESQCFELHEPRNSFREDAVELAITGLLQRIERRC